MHWIPQNSNLIGKGEDKCREFDVAISMIQLCNRAYINTATIEFEILAKYVTNKNNFLILISK